MTKSLLLRMGIYILKVNHLLKGPILVLFVSDLSDAFNKTEVLFVGHAGNKLKSILFFEKLVAVPSELCRERLLIQ